MEVLREQMSRTPPWEPELCLSAAGFEAGFYKKDDWEVFNEKDHLFLSDPDKYSLFDY